MERRGRWLTLAAFLAVTFAVAAAGSAFTAPAVNTWYQEIARPPWNPPGWVFAPVWTALYAAMAVAAWLVWRAGGRCTRPALFLYGVQLALNVSWSAAFFGLRSPGAGLLVIVALLLAVAGTTILFARLDRTAGWLFAPYLAWVAFATALNWSIWRLNA
jgi:tryptophan-rich sensory protein